MMRFKSFCIVVLVCYATAFSGSVDAQTNPVKIKFEVDSKESNQPFKILLSVERSAIFEPPISDNGIVFPPELRNSKWLQLRFISGEYDLYYENVHISKFDGEMTFGVDNAPFDEDRLKTIFGVDDEGDLKSNPDLSKELILIYYLETENVCQTISVYK